MTIRASDRRALLLIFDGLGFNRSVAAGIVDAAWDKLPHGTKDQLLAQARNSKGRSRLVPIEELARLSLYPVHAEALGAETPFEDATETMAALSSLSRRTTRVRPDVDATIRFVARDRRYVPWIASTPLLSSLRNDGLSWPTSAAGIWAGFEELDPAVQGNSDTGHQQIGNLTMAPQTPLEITQAIADGSFFRNEALRGALESARRSGGTVNFCFLLSGTRGDDGRVHSAWNHLEAFLKLAFEDFRFEPARVRMQAILDGRDCPADASIKAHDGAGDYLGALERLLRRYDAIETLAWVIGRNIAMDRDYREPNARADYRLLAQAQGRAVSDFAAVRAAIEAAHGSGRGDSGVEPIVVLDRNGQPRRLRAGDSFVNLQFRADRQRAKTGSLLAAREYLTSAARAHGKDWTLDWIDDSLRMAVCTMADYDPKFKELGARVAFPNRPQQDNFLALFPEVLPGERYLLAGESVKSAHVGYFIRGRREAPAAEGIEDREIIPSCGEAEGVASDADFYKTPGMRNREIAEFVKSRLGERYRLIVANFSNCDMIGHLLPERFDAAIKACEALDAALRLLVPAARSAGYDVVLTSDHGNIEGDTTAHSLNDVLTTVLLSGAGSEAPRPARRNVYQAKLYDIPWTLGRLFGVEDRLRNHVSRSPSEEEQFIGGPLIEGL